MGYTTVGEEVRDVAVSLFHAPMRPHKTVPRCTSRKTLAACMETGLGTNGYDCSGLVIAAVTRAHGLTPADWQKSYRHVVQMAGLANRDGGAWDWVQRHARLGDCLVFQRVIGAREWPSHMGIITRLPDDRGDMILTHAARPTVHFRGEVIPQRVEPNWFNESRVYGLVPLVQLVSDALAPARKV